MHNKRLLVHVLYVWMYRSQTYSANEVELILAIGEKEETIEWVDIDPEAFTGTAHPEFHFTAENTADLTASLTT